MGRKGFALANLGKDQQEIAYFDKALEIDPKDEGAWFEKALAEDELDREQDIIRSYERFIALAPAQYKEQIEYARQRLKEPEK
jgi:tetratricopeptide (TPR) repeat protein